MNTLKLSFGTVLVVMLLEMSIAEGATSTAYDELHFVNQDSYGFYEAEFVDSVPIDLSKLVLPKRSSVESPEVVMIRALKLFFDGRYDNFLELLRDSSSIKEDLFKESKVKAFFLSNRRKFEASKTAEVKLIKKSYVNDVGNKLCVFYVNIGGNQVRYALSRKKGSWLLSDLSFEHPELQWFYEASKTNEKVTIKRIEAEEK